MRCVQGLEVEILKSAAGYYLGTRCPDGSPNCRISTKYAKTREEAKRICKPDRCYSMEIQYCNMGAGCFANSTGPFNGG